MKKIAALGSILAFSLMTSCGGGGGGGDSTPVKRGKTFGGAGDEYGFSAHRKADGGFIVAGTTDSSGAGGFDAWVFEVDGEGNMVRETAFGGPSDDYALSARQTGDGGFIVTGVRDATFLRSERGDWVPGNTDGVMFLRKVDGFLNPVWEKEFTYYPSGYTTAGYEVRELSGGDYLVIGDTRRPGVGYTYMIKTDGVGNLLWEAILDGDLGTGALPTQDGGYAASSLLLGAQGPGWLTKTNAGGLTEWKRQIDQVSLYSLCDVSGGFIVTGQNEAVQGFYVAKIVAPGNISWENTIAEIGMARGFSVLETSDGGIIATGLSSEGGPNHLFDVVLHKFGADGQILWTRYFGKYGNDIGRTVEELPEGGFIIGGSTESWGAGGSDVYLVKTDSEGRAEW